jgi:hypothetical protein
MHKSTILGNGYDWDDETCCILSGDHSYADYFAQVFAVSAYRPATLPRAELFDWIRLTLPRSE